MKRYVLYHNDADGFCAAWVAHGVLGDDAEYIPVQYNQPFPSINPIGAEVYILDFSYDRGTLESLADAAGKLVVLDHHKTAAEQLAGAPWAHYNNEHSGAWLAWWWFHGGGDGQHSDPWAAPRLVRYVEDRDLWRWRMEHSRAINAAISAVPFEFEAWDELAKDLDPAVDMASTRFHSRWSAGCGIMAWQQLAAKAQADNACLIEFEGEEVFCMNTTLLISEIGQELSANKAFSVTWFRVAETGKYVVSLRSKDGGSDVGEIAKRHGGGGHKHSAGFGCDELPWE